MSVGFAARRRRAGCSPGRPPSAAPAHRGRPASHAAALAPVATKTHAHSRTHSHHTHTRAQACVRAHTHMPPPTHTTADSTHTRTHTHVHTHTSTHCCPGPGPCSCSADSGPGPAPRLWLPTHPLRLLRPPRRALLGVRREVRRGGWQPGCPACRTPPFRPACGVCSQLRVVAGGATGGGVRRACVRGLLGRHAPPRRPASRAAGRATAVPRLPLCPPSSDRRRRRLHTYLHTQSGATFVCRARKLSDEQRSAIASYFAVYKGQERGVAKLVLTSDDHPAIARAYALLREAFEEVGGHTPVAHTRAAVGAGRGPAAAGWRARGRRLAAVDGSQRPSRPRTRGADQRWQRAGSDAEGWQRATGHSTPLVS